MTASSFDLDKERRHLELLKRRFGESQMHYCEVILKDVEDSGRINKHIIGRTGLKVKPNKRVTVKRKKVQVSACFYNLHINEIVSLA